MITPAPTKEQTYKVYKLGDAYCHRKARITWGTEPNRRLTPEEIEEQIARLQQMNREYLEREGRGYNGGEERDPPSNNNNAVEDTPMGMLHTGVGNVDSFLSRMKLAVPGHHQQPVQGKTQPGLSGGLRMMPGGVAVPPKIVP